MEFYVVDPKQLSFNDWTIRIREFLNDEGLAFKEEDGELYYRGDDIAAAWDENSVLFTVEGDAPGMIELRDADRSFYVFSDDLTLFDDSEVNESVGMKSRPAGALYGFGWNDQKSCRFHQGPAAGFHYFYDDEEADYPPDLALDEVWSLFFRALEWTSENISRIQDMKGISVEDANLAFEVEVTFRHPASLDALNEILAEEDGYERTKNGLRARFSNRNVGWLKQFVALLPPEMADYDRAFFRAVWAGMAGGTRKELFYTGVERRNLRPFVQLPVHRTTKQLMERFRTYFKGHRIDRQEYYL